MGRIWGEHFFKQVSLPQSCEKERVSLPRWHQCVAEGDFLKHQVMQWVWAIVHYVYYVYLT